MRLSSVWLPNKILIYGKGGHAMVVKDLLLANSPTWHMVFYQDGDRTDLEYWYEQGYHMGTCGVGGAMKHLVRRKVFRRLKKAGYELPTLIHPSAVVSESAIFGEGCQVLEGAIVQTGARIGDNCLINTGAIVSHDCRLGSNVHVGPGATIGGGAIIGNDCLIGMNATVFLMARINENTVVKNGENV